MKTASETATPNASQEVSQMKDEVMSSLKKIKEDIAREHDHDLKRIGAMIRGRERAQAHRVVDRASSRKREYRSGREGREVS